MYDAWRDEGLFCDRQRTDNVHTRRFWDYRPPYKREDCHWRVGNKYGIWAPTIPGLDLAPRDSFTQEEGEERDRVILLIRWG